MKDKELRKLIGSRVKPVSYTHLKIDMERQELQMLISDISHQVKTPVSNLQMVTDTLLTKPVSEEERMDFLQGIRSQTDKLDFLFQALVKTSRLETGAIRLEKKDSSLFHTLAQAMSSIVYAAEKKEIAVSVDCPCLLYTSPAAALKTRSVCSSGGSARAGRPFPCKNCLLYTSVSEHPYCQKRVI